MNFDPLWVPVLTHYNETSRVDPVRTTRHLHYLSKYVRQFLIAGTTGDGWELSDECLQEWIDLIVNPSVLSKQHTVLIGAFGKTTREVIDRAVMIEDRLKNSGTETTFAGLTVCAPVNPNATQEEIISHFNEIVDATTSPLGIYQLPQVVGCEISPETFATLANTHERIHLLKDTSGEDKLVRSNRSQGNVKFLRGAEGDYAGHIKPQGLYDGWLISTANGFAKSFREILELIARGELNSAHQVSDSISRIVSEIFGIANQLSFGNPFANANRAVDHIHAYGNEWEKHKAVASFGNELPTVFVAEVFSILKRAGHEIQDGYMIA